MDSTIAKVGAFAASAIITGTIGYLCYVIGKQKKYVDETRATFESYEKTCETWAKVSEVNQDVIAQQVDQIKRMRKFMTIQQKTVNAFGELAPVEVRMEVNKIIDEDVVEWEFDKMTQDWDKDA